METVVKTVTLSQTKKIFKKYATKLVEVLESRGVKMIEESGDALHLHWQSFREEGCARICIDMYDNSEFGSLGFFILINYPSFNNFAEKNLLESIIRKNTEDEIRKKYPLTNILINLTATGSKAPILKPTERVVNQLCLALKYYNKISSSKIRLKIEKANKRIYKFVEKKADIITESFFQ